MQIEEREALSLEQIGESLKEARQSRGLSESAASDLLKIPESVLAEIEKGYIEGRFKEIYGLISLYTVPIYEIFKGFFNSDSLDTNKEGTEIKDCADYVFSVIRFQKKLNNKPTYLASVPLARGKVGNKPTSLSGIAELRRKRSLKPAVPSVLESRAKEVLHQHKLHKLPINVYQIAVNLGINVSFETFPSDLYMKLRGFCYKEDGFGLIGINKSHPVPLQRFTAAHELHHYLFDFNAVSFLCGPENVNAAFEWNAERFAAELLMPRDLVQRLLSNPLNISYLTVHLVAEHFGVSYEAAAIRLSKFGLVKKSSDVCEKSYKQKDKQKTEYLLKNKLRYLTAVFGLETGITALQLRDEVRRHHLCGAPLTDTSQTVCWYCGLDVQEPDLKDFCFKGPHRQNPANLSLTKSISFERSKKNKENEDYRQLSFNLNSGDG